MEEVTPLQDEPSTSGGNPSPPPAKRLKENRGTKRAPEDDSSSTAKRQREDQDGIGTKMDLESQDGTSNPEEHPSAGTSDECQEPSRDEMEEKTEDNVAMDAEGEEFKEETEILFNDALKDSIIGKFIFAEDKEISYTKDELFKLFEKCFEGVDVIIEFIKQLEKSKKGANQDQDSIEEKVKIQRFLRGCGKNSGNLLHLAAKSKNKLMHEVLKLHNTYLGRTETIDMLSTASNENSNVIHLLVKNNNVETLMENVKIIKDYVNDNEKLKDILSTQGKQNWNILQYFAFHKHMEIDEFLFFCDSICGKEAVIKMLLSPDAKGCNALHLLVVNNSLQTLMKNMQIIGKYIDNNEQFKHILGSQGRNNWNVLQYFASQKDMEIEELLLFCDSICGKDIVIKMLLSTDDKGNNALHHLIWTNSLPILVENMQIIGKYIENVEQFKHILGSQGQNNWNILQYFASQKDMEIEELLLFCDSICGKDFMIKMLLSTDDNGNNALHLLVVNNSLQTLTKNLQIIGKYIDNNEQYKHILGSQGQHNWHVLQYFAFHKNLEIEELLLFCDSICGKHLVKKMLLSPDEKGQNILHLLKWKNSLPLLMKNKQFIGNYIDNV